MALTAGELNVVLAVDDRAVQPALRRVEQAMRSTGQQVGDDAERAGQEAGEELGEGLVRGADGAGEDAGRLLGQGLVRGADGQWRNMRGELVDAVTAAAAEAEGAARRGGQQAGQALGDGLEQGADQGADQATTAATGRLEKLKMGAAAIGAVAGAMLMSAMADAMDQSRITGRLGAQLGATPAEAQRYGKLAGQLYADAVTEDFQGAADAISAVMRAGIAPPGATNAQLKSIATNVSDLASTFELDLGQASNAVGQMIKTGIAKNGREALDVMTVGLQKMGPRADDIADTFNEYSTIFRNMGLSAKDATGLMSQGMKAGARDTDIVADAIKEFSIEAVAGSDKIGKAWDTLHLDSDKLFKQVAAGGDQAKEALDQTLQALATMEPGVERNALAVELFGTKAEDLGDALFALDPASASDALGKVGGAADKMGDTLRENSGTRLESFKRNMQQNVVDFLGGQVIPAFGKVKDVAGKALGSMWAEAGKNADSGGLADRIVAFVPLLGQKLLEKAKELAPKMIEGIMGAGQTVAEWIMANPTQVLKIAALAAAITMALVALPALAAAAIAAAGISLMVGFVSSLISALVENVPRWWSSFTGWVSEKAGQAGAVFSVLGSAVGSWFGGLWSKYISGPVSRTWNSFITTVQGLPGRASNALSGLALAITLRAVAAWNSFRDASVQRALGLVTWVAGLPSRISAGIGSLSGLLTQKGRNVVQGLWVGIQGMGGWIRDRIIGWAKSVIPGPIAKALGISSPSKVTAAQGKWIARGLVDGLTGSTKQVKAASYKLVDIVKDALTGKRERAALKRINKDANNLVFNANWADKVASQLKNARKKLDDLKKERSKLVADVKKGVLSDADITKQDSGGWAQTAETILAGLKQDTAAAVTFAKHLATLRKKGVRSDLIAQIAQAGVTGGASSAAALANANSSQIKQINAQQSTLVKAAGQAGTTAGDAMYKAGIQAAEGLVKGLTKHQKYIESTMLRIAKGMSSAIRKALGIKSPSRVMAAIGVHTAQGLIRGVEGQRSAVNRSMASLVETPAPGSWDMASGRARAAASQRVVLELRSSGRQADEFVMESMRRGVRKKGGGDVDLVLAGRRNG
ncbi:phage tail tape measure protein [Streptomyces sp. NPDC005774]|uniref:phage tail tape measure protein n=1 Tax=Streptomyces sp. NPDC005774 TaxID=3364728 RepID=UPI003682B06E